MPRDPRAYLSDICDSYDAIDDAIVWAIIQHDVPELRRECTSLLHRIGPGKSTQ